MTRSCKRNRIFGGEVSEYVVMRAVKSSILRGMKIVDTRV